MAWMNWLWCSVRCLDFTTRLNVVSVSRPIGISLAIVTPSRAVPELLMIGGQIASTLDLLKRRVFVMVCR